MYKPEGLWIEALITDPEAMRMPAFSISAQVLEYTIEDRETPDFWAKVTRGKLREVSLTDYPANRDCLITRRFEVPASNEMYDLMMGKTTRLAQVAQHIIQLNKCEEARRFR